MNYALFLPEFLLVGLAFLVLGIDLFLPRERKGVAAYISAVGLLVVAASALSLRGVSQSLFGGLFLVDDYALFFKFFFPLIAVFVCLISTDYVKKYLSHAGEYYGFILFSTLAMMLMSAAGELLTAYIALELLSFSLYVLTAYAKNNPKSNEAGIKYILLGAFSSALLLYGMSLVYGLARTTTFEGIAAYLSKGGVPELPLIAALALIIAGLGFKVAAAPFHMWAPDVYEGAPAPVTAYLSVASKAAGFALLLRLFAVAFLPAIDQWRWIIIALSAVTMTLGNLVAISQANIKRLLAYSSIGQVGYLLVGVAAFTPQGDPTGASAIVLHLAGYAISNLAVFACVIIYTNHTDKEDIADYAGLAERMPFVALSLSVSLLSLAGLPFFAGFATKFYLFYAGVKEGLIWLVALAVLNSLVSLYYYLNVMKVMYVSPPAEAGRLRLSLAAGGVLALLTLGVVVVGLYPAPLLDLIDQAVAVLF